MKSFKHLDHTTKALGVAGLAGVMMVSGCCTKSYKTASYKQRNVSYASAAPAESYSASEQVQTPTPTGRTEETKNMVVPLYQENLNVGKREVESGSVRLRKIVKTETVNQPVELRREELVIDRDNGNANGEKVLAQPFQEQETVIRLKREEPVIEKQTVPAGQVTVQTRTTQEQRNIQAQVRREDIDVDRHGAQNVIIGQNVHRSVRVQDSTGAGETSTGTSAGFEANVISDPAQLTTTTDASTLNGKQVRLNRCKVNRIVGEKLIVLDADNGQQIYVISNGGDLAKFHQGDKVMIKGTVKAGNASEAGLSGEAAQELSNRPLYIQADRIHMSGEGHDKDNDQSSSPNSNENQNQNTNENQK